MAQSRTTKLSKLLLVLSTVLILVPFVINSHRHPEGPPPPEFRHGPFPMAMERPMREGMRHRERSVGAAMPEGISDRKVMPMPAQADDVAPVLLPRGDMPHPPPHGRRHCMKGVLAGVVGVVGLVAGATESRKAVTVFIVVIALAFTASTAMSIFRAHHKVESCRAQQSIVALGRDFHPEMPQQMPMRPAFDRPMPNQLSAQASSGMAVVNANVDLNTMDRADGVNQIQPVSGADIVEVEEIDIEIEVRDDSASTSSDAVGGAGVLPSSRRAAKALHKRGPWGHGRRHNELPLNGHHGHHGHPGGNDCERAVKHRTAHKVGCSIIITAVFLIIARLLRKSIAADEEAAGVTAVATTKCGGEVYEGVPVKCSSDDVVVVV